MKNIDQISAHMLALAAGGSNTQVNQEPEELRTAKASEDTAMEHSWKV